jgi:hypothetical protein
MEPGGKKHEASFGNINEGTYTFKVKARYTGPGINGQMTGPNR